VMCIFDNLLTPYNKCGVQPVDKRSHPLLLVSLVRSWTLVLFASSLDFAPRLTSVFNQAEDIPMHCGFPQKRV